MKTIIRSIISAAGLTSCLMLCACTKQLPGIEPVQTPLTAEQHLLQAQRYKQSGRIELCRSSLLKAIKIDGNCHAAKLAQQYLKYNLPKAPVSLEAEQRNIIAFNQAKNGDIPGAKQNFSNLIKDFPDFEWPYANLAGIYAKEHNLDEAESLLKKALSINPDYANARGLLLKVQSIKSETRTKQQPDDLALPD